MYAHRPLNGGPAALPPGVAARPGTMVSYDQAVRRAAGVILHHMRNGYEMEDALQRASKREPELTDRQLRFALDWALAQMRLTELCRSAGPGERLCDLMDRAGVPWRNEDMAE